MEPSPNTAEGKEFDSPEEEISFLREQVAQKEQELRRVGKEPHQGEIIRDKIESYQYRPPDTVLTEGHRIAPSMAEKVVLELAPEEHDSQMEKLITMLDERGLRNTLSVLEKMHNPHLEDDFHRYLVQYVQKGMHVSGMKERDAMWNATHMTLYEIALPSYTGEKPEQPLKELGNHLQAFDVLGMLGRGKPFEPATIRKPPIQQLTRRKPPRSRAAAASGTCPSQPWVRV